ncbi:hypothetical protein Cgig2_024757 [Carnegiea gigantea]|uniref:Uncharacterized protein n=1 Tax=Carnegiea gigantea TaxID=171969 RepID=A0A9Q1JXW3_9CARY|nr:hypothetical protein Cgig2_024757 [Carnegiea gigantea]
MIPEKLALWLVCNFGTCSYSLPLTHGRMRVTEHDVHITLGLPKGALEVVKPNYESIWLERDSIRKCGEVIEMIRGQVDGGEDFKRNFVTLVVSPCLRDSKEEKAGQEFVIGFGRSYIEDTLDKTTIMKRNVIAKMMKMKLKKKFCTYVVLPHSFELRWHLLFDHKLFFGDAKATTDSIMTNSRLLAEVVTELKEFIPKARTPLKRSVQNRLVMHSSVIGLISRRLKA